MGDSPASSPAPSAGLPVAVVGAGPAGLATARALRVRGLPYLQFERHGDVGGIWDIDNPGTPMYESAHFISSRDKSGFFDFPMPEDLRRLSVRTEILEYTHSFADAFGLRGRDPVRHRGFGSRQEDGRQLDPGNLGAGRCGRRRWSAAPGSPGIPGCPRYQGISMARSSTRWTTATRRIRRPAGADRRPRQLRRRHRLRRGCFRRRRVHQHPAWLPLHPQAPGRNAVGSDRMAADLG